MLYFCKQKLLPNSPVGGRVIPIFYASNLNQLQGVSATAKIWNHTAQPSFLAMKKACRGDSDSCFGTNSTRKAFGICFMLCIKLRSLSKQWQQAVVTGKQIYRIYRVNVFDYIDLWLQKCLCPFLSQPLDDMHITLTCLIKDVSTTATGKCVHKIQTATQNAS